MSDEVMRASVEMAAAIKEVWSADFYPTLLERLPFNRSVARDYEGDIQDRGDRVYILNIPQFDEADDLAENEKANADSTTIGSTALDINHQLAKDFIITKKARIQSLDTMDALQSLAMHAVMKKLQSLIIADISPSTSSPDHVIAYDSGTTLALADILEAKELLDDQNVEEQGRVSVLDSPQYNDLFNITGFTSKDFIPSGSPLSSGAITLPILGFDVEWTTEASATSYFFHPIFMQLAIQQMPEISIHELGQDGKRGMRVNLDVLLGIKQASNLRVVTVS